jgi:hypothetical protein
MKEIQKLYIIVAFGLLLLTAICFYLIQTETITESKKYLDILTKAVPMSIVIGLSASFYFGNKHLKKMKVAKKSADKFQAYKNSIRIKNICLVIPGLIACIASILSGEAQFLFIALAVLIVMLIAFPSSNKAMTIMEIDQKIFDTIK